MANSFGGVGPRCRSRSSIIIRHGSKASWASTGAPIVGGGGQAGGGSKPPAGGGSRPPTGGGGGGSVHLSSQNVGRNRVYFVAARATVLPTWDEYDSKSTHLQTEINKRIPK